MDVPRAIHTYVILNAAFGCLTISTTLEPSLQPSKSFSVRLGEKPLPPISGVGGG